MLSLIDCRAMPMQTISCCHVRHAEKRDGGYRSGALVPDGQWVVVDPRDTPEFGRKHHDWDADAAIAVMNLPSEVVRVFFELGVTARAGSVTPQLLERFMKVAQKFCASAEYLSIQGLSGAPPNTLTLTTDPTPSVDVIRRLGLHLDCDSEPGRPMLPWNRMCVNVGTEPRWFLVVPSLVDEIKKFVGRMGVDISTLRGHHLADFFLRSCKPRVFRVSILPGDAYIAPTQRIIHDGSTMGVARAGLSFHMTGQFCPALQPST